MIERLASFTTREGTVFSYISIFENLWIKTQLHKRGRQEEKVTAK
jgi:hypothetical protein